MGKKYSDNDLVELIGQSLCGYEVVNYAGRISRTTEKNKAVLEVKNEICGCTREVLATIFLTGKLQDPSKCSHREYSRIIQENDIPPQNTMPYAIREVLATFPSKAFKSLTTDYHKSHRTNLWSLTQLEESLKKFYDETGGICQKTGMNIWDMSIKAVDDYNSTIRRLEDLFRNDKIEKTHYKKEKELAVNKMHRRIVLSPDRINSSDRNYSISNVIWVHPIANIAKMNLSEIADQAQSITKSHFSWMNGNAPHPQKQENLEWAWSVLSSGVELKEFKEL